jgi:hypothetical protein
VEHKRAGAPPERDSQRLRLIYDGSQRLEKFSEVGSF